MNIFFIFLFILSSALVSIGILFYVVPLLRVSLLDHPNGRSSHSQPTPRGGGAAFVLVSSAANLLFCLFCSSSASAQLGLVISLFIALPLALVGFLDDRHNLPSTLRYCVQLATALSVIIVSPLVDHSMGLFLIFLFVIAVTAIINFINFMDGLDGLVAGCIVVSISSAAIRLAAPWPVWALVGALLGFLLWNWSPAKVFMGDVGSTFLGVIFALLVLQASTWPEALGMLLVATPLLSDAFLCVPRRLIAGQRVFQAHRLHLFQRLHQAGWPHAQVSSLYIAATAVLAIVFLFGGLEWVITLSVLELLCGIWLDQQVAVPFAVASRS